MKAVIPLLLGLITLISCSGDGATFEFYVVIRPDETAKLIRAVTSIAKEDGLETAVGQTVFDSGEVWRVVEGRGHGLKLWVQSAPLSGHEDPKLCGLYVEPHPDPAQFIVSTEPKFFRSKAAAKELGEQVFSQLHESGFDVRREPPVCGTAAIHDHS